ncbi:MAG: hypothetical protein K2L21_04115 [Muribaculaceae bacterium]|nr:hypothetical protein [Muribaculaceae bacterium]
MKKSLLLMMLVFCGCVAAWAQENVNFHLVLDDASRLKVAETYYDSSAGVAVENILDVTDGDNTLSIQNYHTIQITAKDGFFLKECVRESTGSNYYISNKQSTQIFVETGIEGDTFTITTCPESESRTASVTVNIDRPDDINMTRYMINGFISFTEPSTVVLYDPTDELPLTFSTKNYQQKIYKVTVSEGTVEESYGQWRVTPEDGAVIDVQVAFPDKDVTYTLISESGNFDFLRVRAGIPYEDIDISSGSYTLKAGTPIEYNFDTSNYKIDEFLIDGVPCQSLYSYSFTASDDATHSFKAHPFATFDARVHVTPADKARVLKGGLYGDPAECVDGVYTVRLKEPYDVQLTVAPVTDYYISDVRVEPEPDSEISFNKSSFYYSCTGDCDIYVELGEVVYDKKTALYVDNSDLLDYINSSSAFDNSIVFPEPATGYTVYDVSLAKSPAIINGYITGVGPVSRVYLNHTRIEKASEWSTTYTVDYQGDDVVHIYIENDPETASLSFDIDEGLEVEAVHNKVVTVTDPAAVLELFKGDEVAVKVNAGDDNYELTVNDDAVEPDDAGSHVFNLADGANVVKIIRHTLLRDIVADGDDSNAPVYNLQGIRVDAANLPAGVYIRNGKKFRVR